jgi:glutathione S-transferase
VLSKQLRSQAGRGRPFLVGDRLSALDLYWATFAVLVRPLPPDLCALPDWLRKTYTMEDRSMLDALDPSLLGHRDRIYRAYLELPIVA